MKHRIVPLNLAIIFFLVLSSAGCGGGTPSPTPLPSPLPSPRPPQATPTPGVDLSKLLDDRSPLPPQVVSSQAEVSPAGPVEVAFDHPMDQPSTEAAWALVGPDGKQVSGKAGWVDPSTFRFTPSEPLQSGGIYLASFTTGAKSAEGAALREPARIRLEVTGDLRISQVFPADGVLGVENTSVITVLFNRPVVPLVAAEEMGRLPDPLMITPETAGKGEWVNTSVYTFHPEKPLRNGVFYNVRIKAGLTAVGGEGAPLAQDFAWSFTTVAPSVASFKAGKLVNPEEGGVDIPLNATFSISFRQAMDPASSEAALALQADGKKVVIDTTWDKEYKTLSIASKERLSYETRYELVLDSSAQAAAGGNLDKPFSYSFPDRFASRCAADRSGGWGHGGRHQRLLSPIRLPDGHQDPGVRGSSSLHRCLIPVQTAVSAGFITNTTTRSGFMG